MNKSIYTGKNLEEAINNAKIALEEQEENLIIKNREVVTGGLFKKKSVEVVVYQKSEINKFIKEKVKEIISNMGLTVQMEFKIREGVPYISLYSENNNLLIGRNGKNIEALSTVIRQILINELGENYKFSIDVEEYKEKRDERFVRLAKRVAREVKKTKVDANLDPMNSYERRIIHNALTDYKNIKTESEGEEPNRYVVIKYTEE